MKIDDEVLVAYADGELDAHQAAQVERAVAADSELQARLAALTQAAELTRTLFEAKANEPAPDALVQSILAADPHSASASAIEHTGWWDRLVQWWRLPLPATAFAAVALVAVGVLVGSLLPPGGQPAGSMITAGVIPSGSSLGRLLNDHVSGAIVESGDLRIEAVATFLTDQRVCREYRATNEAPQRREYHAGIACLHEDGDWHVAFAVEEYLEREPVAGFYETASDKLHEAVDAFIDEDLGVDPLEDGEEARLLDRGWRSN
jgi:anti-sigma-K factor RskA